MLKNINLKKHIPNLIIAVLGVEDPSSSRFNILHAFDILYNIKVASKMCLT